MKRLLFILCFLAVPVGGVRADLVIDNFTTNQRVEVPTGALGMAMSQVSGPGILGSFRDMILTKVSGVPEASSEAFFDGTVGTLFFSAGVGNRATLELQYDGGTDSANPALYVQNGLTAFDATQGGTVNGIGIVARSDAGDSDQIASTLTVTFTANGVDYNSSITFIESNHFENYFIPFSAFPGLGANAQNVTAVKIRIDATADASQDIAFRLFSLSAVPAPSGAMLGGSAAALGLALMWLRRRANPA